MSSKAKPAAAAAAEPAKSGGKSRLLIIIAAVVVLGGGGAGAFFMMRKPAAETEEAKSNEAEDGHKAKAGGKHKSKKKEAEPGLLSLEPFTVNLADGGSHYLRLNVRLLVDAKPEEAEKMQKNEVLVMRVRSSILELLAQQKADELVTPEGKTELKHQIAEHMNEVLEDTEVADVLFSDFVVQF